MPFDLAPAELKIFRSLSTPAKIQDFLDRLPINFELAGETLMSPRRVLRFGRAHCFEAALLAAASLWFHRRPPLLMDFKTTPDDEYHVVALFREGGRWGAISKTNHPIIRYRDAVYASPRELAISYFHEYFDFKTGRKTLRSYSSPLSLVGFGHGWVTAEEDLWSLDQALNRARHWPLVPAGALRRLRPADRLTRWAAARPEWPPGRRH